MLKLKIITTLSLVLFCTSSFSKSEINICNKLAAELMNDAIIRGVCGRRFPSMKKSMEDFFKSTLLGKIEPYCTDPNYPKEKYEKDIALFKHFFDMPEVDAMKICKGYKNIQRNSELEYKEEILNFVKSKNDKKP